MVYRSASLCKRAHITMKSIAFFTALLNVLTVSDGIPVQDAATSHTLISHRDGQTYYNGTLIAEVFAPRMNGSIVDSLC